MRHRSPQADPTVARNIVLSNQSVELPLAREMPDTPDMAWLYSRIVPLALLTSVACSSDNRPVAPAECKAPFTLLTPWWDDSAAYNGDAACSSPDLLLDRLQAYDGTVYYASTSDMCAVDASGIRKVATALDGGVWGFIEDFWIDAGQLLFTEGHGLYAVPLAGGARTTLATLPSTLQGQFAYDGSYLYWGSGYGDRSIYRTPSDGGPMETVVAAVPNDGVARLGISGDRLDFLPSSASGASGLLQRMQLSTRALQSIDLSTQGSLLASTAGFTYVMYAKGETPNDGFSDHQMKLGMIGPDGEVTAAWTGAVPDFSAGGAAIHGNTLYAGGRLRYHGGEVFLGIVAVPIGSDQGKVIGCSPAKIESEGVPPYVSAVAVDDNYSYAIINHRTNPSDDTIRHAIARFPRP